MALTLVIGNKNYSSWSLRAWLALNHTGTPFEEVVVPLYEAGSTAAITRYSPSGKVPVLRDGDVTVWESLAICEYLAEKFPDKGLWPRDGAARAVARAISNEMHAGFRALRDTMVMNIRAKGRKVEMGDAVTGEIQRIADIWAAARAKFGAGGPFLFGTFTIADAMYAPVVTRFRTYGVALEGEAKTYADAVWDMPAMQTVRKAAAAEPWVIERFERGRLN